MTDDILVFDKAALRKNRNRSAPQIKDHSFLFDWCQKEITQRLKLVNRSFPTALQIGNRTPPLDKKGLDIETLHTMDLAENLKPDILADEEFLPFKENSLDLVVNNLGLHSINDLPGHLIQVKTALKPDGLFVGTLFGGETLCELRQCLQQAELEQTGGMSPRIAPFADKIDIGALMQRSNLALPVIDSEILTVTYDNIFNLLQDLRLMGESNTLLKRPRTTPSRELFMKAGDIYRNNFAEKDGRLVATFEIIFVHGWKPHDSQQKPLIPGSAKTPMADALNTTEEKLPC